MIVSVVDPGEIPSTRDDLRVRFAGTGSGFQENERFYIDRISLQVLAFLIQRVGCNPNTIL